MIVGRYTTLGTMATETTDYAAVLAFVRQAEQRDCLLAEPALPERLCTQPGGGALDAGLADACAEYQRSGRWCRSYRVFATGWTELEGVLILALTADDDTDIQASITATNERALRELLLAFPRGRVGHFSYAAPWMLPTLTELLDGDALPGQTAYRGIKRGSGRVGPDTTAAPAPRDRHPADTAAVDWREQVLAAPPPRRKRRDPAVDSFRDLLTIKGRAERQCLSIEEPLLVRRALADGLPVLGLLYTEELLTQPEGPAILEQAEAEHVTHQRVSKGIMGTVTATRPLPWVVAAVHVDVRDAAQLHCSSRAVLLIADCVANPANLGMILRTADAAGVEAVILLGANSASPFHKHCVRAARGAMGRLPLYTCKDPARFFQRLKTAGFALVGATVEASADVYRLALRPPVALVVGNESAGIRPAILAACTDRVRIPMAPGQSSLNVGVAAGVLLYELVRTRLTADR